MKKVTMKYGKLSIEVLGVTAWIPVTMMIIGTALAVLMAKGHL